MSTPTSSAAVHELDVRPIIAARGAPLGPILQAVRALPPGGSLRLIAPFEPVPLYHKLGEMGFDHVTRVRDDGAWEVLFSPRAPATPDPLMLDLRGLEPPEPLRIALEHVATLPPGGVVIAHTRFRPVHLLSILDERGIAWETHEQADGSWETIMRKEAAGA